MPGSQKVAIYWGFHIDGHQHTRHVDDACSMLGHRLWRWPNINPALGRRVAIAGMFIRMSLSIIWVCLLSFLRHTTSTVSGALPQSPNQAVFFVLLILCENLGIFR